MTAYEALQGKFKAEVSFRPFFKIEALSSREFREQRINLPDYTAIIFSSRHAIDAYFKLAEDLRFKVPETMKYFCTIETIALYIQKYVQYRKRKVFFGTNGKIDGLLPQMMRHKDERYLVPMSSVHTDEITNLLDSKGLKHKECVMYRTVSNDFTEEEKKDADYDMLLFFSPTGVKALKSNFPDFVQGEKVIGAFGPATAKTVVDLGLRLDFGAPSKECPSMTSALDAYLKEHK
jgi:uroporphyrinogen-III synthase